MRQRTSELRRRGWAVKTRLFPWTRPKAAPVPRLALPAPPAPAAPDSEPFESPEQVWSELLAGYLPPLDLLTVLDLGCGAGELVRYLAEHSRARQLIGVDSQPYWSGGEPMPASPEGPRIRLLAGDLGSLGLEPRSVDAIVCSGYFDRQTPEAVRETLTACLELLRPGGALVLRTSLCTGPEPSTAYRRFASAYPQLLVGERDLARLLRGRFDEALPYRNWLTATSYLMMFHQAGFETLDVRRIPAPEPDPELAARVDRVLALHTRGELAQGLEAHLVRPFTLEDLMQAGRPQDTRPESIRELPAGS